MSARMISSVVNRQYHEHVIEAAERRARDLQRKADAEMVEAAGCICWDVDGVAGADDPSSVLSAWDPGEESPHIVRHDPRCPVALAAQIRSGE